MSSPTSVTPPDPQVDEVRRDALVGRLFEAVLGAFDLLVIRLGQELGLYEALRDHGPATPGELAARAPIAERYAREWLEHQAVAGVLDVAEPSDDPARRRYALPAGHAEVLLEPDSLSTMAPMPAFVASIGPVWPTLVEAYRTGAGVDWSAYPGLSEAQELANRPAFRHRLAQDWLPQVPDVHARLQAGGARVADVATGAGHAAIALGAAYPGIEVDGLDLDAPAIDRARAHATAAGVADRVRFHVVDAGDPALEGRYDLVTIFEAVHDLARPVEVLAAVRGLLTEGGTAIVMDEKVAETFTAPGDDVERLMYGYSVLVCLPNGLADKPSTGTGTVMRPSTLRAYAEAAGFRQATILPIDDEMFRFYRLDP